MQATNPSGTPISRLEWDAEREVITNHDEANKLLHYDYREPWKLG